MTDHSNLVPLNWVETRTKAKVKTTLMVVKTSRPHPRSRSLRERDDLPEAGRGEGKDDKEKALADMGFDVVPTLVLL